jgi:hypothetical protein
VRLRASAHLADQLASAYRHLGSMRGARIILAVDGLTQGMAFFEPRVQSVSCRLRRMRDCQIHEGV